jgi:hypothetical protein
MSNTASAASESQAVTSSQATAGAVCLAYTYTCTTANVIAQECGVAGATYSSYDWVNSPADCVLTRGMAPAGTSAVFCATSNCNTAAALAAAAAVAPLATCPTTAGATSCNMGITTSANWPTTGGVCSCSPCQGSRDFAANSNATCTAAVCATTYPNLCGGSGLLLTASYESWASWAVKPVATASASNVICFSYIYTCSVANPCPGGLTSGSFTAYSAFTGLNDDGTPVTPVASTPMADCNSTMSDLNMQPAVSSVVVCNTNNCNAPPAASAAASSKPVMALAAAVGAAAVAAYL